MPSDDELIERLRDGDDLHTRMEAASRIAELKAATEWQPIETAPKDVQILFGYFGDTKELHGAAAVGSLFQWEKMPKALASGWPWYSVHPTHWQRLPNNPALSTPSGEVS